MSIYAADLATAIGRFNRKMGEYGAEVDQYSMVGHQEIKEPEISIPSHRHHLNQLTHGEYVSFIQDRAQRQTRENGKPAPDTIGLLNQLSEKATA